MAESAQHPGKGDADLQGRADLPKQYRPTDHENRIRARWEASGAFHPDPERVLRGEAKPYCIFIPPPNVTDRLHLGHALNNTLQDVLARAHRMMGFETMWMPGTDHAGIATQAVVERRLRKEGSLKGPLRESMKREEFIAKVQAFKDEYEATITGQLKAMGCSCDWERQRFTMDEQCARAVYEAFFLLFKAGLIYRGKRLVNWDPVLQTAVADDECFDEEIDGQFYYLRYPLVRKGSGDAIPVTWSELRAKGWPAAEDAEHEDDKQAWITVATTRPETYLGDTAVAINPRDPRAKALRGLSVELPLIGRVIPVVEDDYVVLPAALQADPEEAEKDPKAKFATGFLKVTPAHDPNDYEIGIRHNLERVNMLAPDGTVSDKHGWSDVGDAHILVGKKRDDARKLVVKEFEARGLFSRSVPYRHSVKHSDRSKAIIEPYLSDQWYVKVTDERLAGSALRAMAPEQRTSSSGTATVRERTPANSETGASAPSRSRFGSAGDGDLTFYPGRYAKTFELWHENIRDWCISRQLWWGHRIPVWSVTPRESFGPSDPEASNEAFENLGSDLSGLFHEFTKSHSKTVTYTKWDSAAQTVFVCALDTQSHEKLAWLSNWLSSGASDSDLLSAKLSDDAKSAGRKIRNLAAAVVRDPDVLDTWFSSALWPMSTLGWPDETSLLKAFNPSSTLCTAREIITLWVSRMVMFNRFLRGQDSGIGGGNGPLPFRDVFIHALIMDGTGQKMSKTAGNGVDPLDIIASHGSDAMRFVLCQMTTQTQDVRMPVQKDSVTGRNTSNKFDIGRNFCNKLWQVSTGFALAKLTGASEAARQRDSETAKRTLIDRWMLSRLAAATEHVTSSLKGYEYSEYAQTLYDLMWRDFCDWYIEGIKPTIATDVGQRAVLHHALETIVRLLHPVAPYITEAIWERLQGIKTQPIEGITLKPSRKGDMLCTAGWPEISSSLRDEAAEREFERMRELITAIREVRAQHNVPPKRRITLHCSPELQAECKRAGTLVEALAMVEAISTAAPSGPAVAFTFDSRECKLSNLADAVDAGAEKARLEKVIADAEKTIKTLEGRLANPGYAQKAPPAMVQQTKDQLAKAAADRDAATAALGKL